MAKPLKAKIMSIPAFAAIRSPTLSMPRVNEAESPACQGFLPNASRFLITESMRGEGAVLLNVNKMAEWELLIMVFQQLEDIFSITYMN